eukprot:2183327-Rhodomonas_salina.3
MESLSFLLSTLARLHALGTCDDFMLSAEGCATSAPHTEHRVHRMIGAVTCERGMLPTMLQPNPPLASAWQRESLNKCCMLHSFRLERWGVLPRRPFRLLIELRVLIHKSGGIARYVSNRATPSQQTSVLTCGSDCSRWKQKFGQCFSK